MHKQSFKKLCSGGTDKHAEELYKSFLGDGIYIPFLKDGNLDSETISDHLPMLQKRLTWLKGVEEKLKNEKSLRTYLISLKVLQKDLDKLRSVYHRYYLENSFDKKKNLVKEAKSHTHEFIEKLQKFIVSMYYLQSFEFPVDHFYLRAEYDKYKSSDTEEGKRKANRAYFLRKIVEEGAVNRDKGRSDLTLRALIDSIYMRIDSYSDSFLDNNLAYDIESLFDTLDGVLRGGKREILSRISNWVAKTDKDVTYYSNLLVQQKNKKDFFKKMFNDKNKARYALSDYIYEKEAEVYKFWSEKDLLYRQLFALETILFHEVGRLDDDAGTERSDVLKVVMNRLAINEYNKIDASEPLHSKLQKLNIKNIDKYTWLNVLFKQGEFSFTYFFIPASRGIFCADQSKTASRLRRKNLSLALNLLRSPDPGFLATRYFSRASMLGRIDMAQVWDDYTPIEERPGPRISGDKKLQLHYKNSNYTYLYNFTSAGTQYEVLRMKGTEFVYSPKSKKFYRYRNPHHFKYFIKNKAY
ncbi:hypothetical protein M900_0454 [Bacteriovorax sp. Seq25_V]|nr:hypothetical protein M900_0454 [Bacteriovorax sp. Seq25_V]